MGPIYRVWLCRIPGERETFRAAVSNVREASLRQEIAAGQRQLELVAVEAETPDRNAARRLANGVEL